MAVPEKLALMTRLIAPLIGAVVTILADQAQAQGAFQAPFSNEPSASAEMSPLPPVKDRAPSTSVRPPPSKELEDACLKGFKPLRDEAESLGRLVKQASDRKAPREEVCVLIRNFSHAELKLIGYVDANWVRCGIPQNVVAQLKTGHAKTEELWRRICSVPGV